ncbi:NAD-dependent protein deacetylase [Microtetraspora niveoalba]|uniref:NAD-dependent protein deacetylase n=1 Tax=Microtetraspora niveoalba TaxID=46175 RepID=UPI0009FFD111|nr:NAD-dependent protein deacetylase [Microtetraspora niveoalba]
MSVKLPDFDGAPIAVGTVRPHLGGAPADATHPDIATTHRDTDGAHAAVHPGGFEGVFGEHFRLLADLVADGDVVVLSGAGISTESGIPDYRGESGRRRQADPMTYQTFVGSAAARRRYWARSHLGWRHIARAAPNAGHRAVTGLQERGLVTGIITQNVDGLHQSSGARDVIELHGSLDRVRCLACGVRTPRQALDERLRAANPGWHARVGVINPDGDAVIADDRIDAFRVVDCHGCGGVLKPDVIFFGENVPRPRVEDCYALVERAGMLLVLGSSLTVMSGYRFVRHAAERDIPIAIINRGPTRGDTDALLTFDVPLGATLAALLTHLGP